MQKVPHYKRTIQKPMRKLDQTYFVGRRTIEIHFNLELHRKGQIKVYFHTINQFSSLLGQPKQYSRGRWLWTTLEEQRLTGRFWGALLTASFEYFVLRGVVVCLVSRHLGYPERVCPFRCLRLSQGSGPQTDLLAQTSP